MRTRNENDARDQRIVTGAILDQLREKLAASANAVEFAKGRSSGDLERRTLAAWQKIVEAVEGGLLDESESETPEVAPLDDPNRKHGFFDQVITDAEAVINHMNVIVEQATTCINHGWYGENVSDITTRVEASEAAGRRIAINARRADMLGANTSTTVAIESEAGR